MPERATRRRGALLERGILDAVLEELAATGYGGLTFEGVAARARTSKPVLYRRWPSRAALVLAALVHSRPGPEDVPDTGALRSDVLALLERMARRFADIGPGVVWGLLAETADQPELAARVRADPVRAVRIELMTTMLDRAAARGEIDPARITPRVAVLPLDLLRHELLMYGTAAPETLAGIVDEAFLPLVRRPVL
jgi:AcrR family transcriptional regulator